ncbi:hypothetical protein [Pseudoalteromonas luteoviolacea]|uniref:DUF5610 domain-containing protein n=1 Tax=Pseudoalteromonas luteoviolacea S4054 TaxID=1129367 RepID=A0A0F6AC43_9GAMM|nr:hypothetical protein [Pseudoalteromonas luteoviolacea]AOT06704.1 hypothetical protein S4054249_01870 [Pseudoalteromonas luteoviolacea]AOT11622.1 hypothetical protein S40542_01870 [Pseudoalteromonas luteoviolacea]AOT16534.1 hypothetical protein S4054_01870 [Pseudoalteromonas luteoviolacea]KKE83792.1 hypothetical protein N479_12430 [Pseudoalteromonas luteoviolacea S4054]KZN73925.1 hypothetical protein N481_10825 [Pseudoalteromonas luteoviolacea S4047-1]
MTINFNIHSSLTTSTQAQSHSVSLKTQSESAEVKLVEEQSASDDSSPIAVFSGDAPGNSPYSALLNPEGFDFDNMSINEFHGIVDAIRTLESDMTRASGFTGSLSGTFWEEVMDVKGSLETIDYTLRDFTADEKINITHFFAEHVEGAAQMEKENYRSFHGVLANAKQTQHTAHKIISESFIKDYQEKAVAFLQSQETKIVDTQA